MAPELALGGLQRWLQAVIVHPGTVDQALASREAAALVPAGRTDSVVLPSARLSAPGRIGVYHGMYLARMREALESDYPGLARFLGPEAWEGLVRSYVQVHPSRSYTLNVLGRELPSFVARAPVRRPAFCRDLARLEWAVTEAFDAPGATPLTEDALAAVAPGEWERARLVPVPALRLLVLEHDAGAHVDALREGRRRPPIRRRRCRVVVYRRGDAVSRRQEEPTPFALLEDLVNGVPVGRALARRLEGRGARLGPDEAFRLFRDWAAMGLFRAVEIAPPMVARARARRSPTPGRRRSASAVDRRPAGMR